jgi:hypothetical protein
MSSSRALSHLQKLLSEIAEPNVRTAAARRFPSLEDAEAKIREAKRVMKATDGLPEDFLQHMSSDNSFLALNVEEDLRALSRHVESAISFLESGVLAREEPIIHLAPEISKLVVEKPGLQKIIERRWREAQQCERAKCYTAAIIMMGSILEALLLARALLSEKTAYRSTKAPKKDKDGKKEQVHLRAWTLDNLIEVAADVGWIKTDRREFSHALRDSRNMVHLWKELEDGADFDAATCRTSWEVLRASVDDLIRSCS